MRLARSSCDEQALGVGNREWHVLVVGGPSGAGKSTACGTLLHRFGVGISEIDDLESAVKAG